MMLLSNIAATALFIGVIAYLSIGSIKLFNRIYDYFKER